MAHLIALHYSRADYVDNKLNIYLHPPTNKRTKEAIAKIFDVVNNTNTVFSGINLLMIFHFATF
jgi:uncharacterized membrane protein SirB2